jgi:hypothetical protein
MALTSTFKHIRIGENWDNARGVALNMFTLYEVKAVMQAPLKGKPLCRRKLDMVLA